MKHIGKFLAALSVVSMTACTNATAATLTPPLAPTATSTTTLTPTPTLTPTLTPTTYPMRLEQVGQLGGIADALALSGDIIYLQAGPRLVTADVSNPYAPTPIGRSETLPGGIKAIGALDHYALVGDDEGMLWIFDAPASADPRVVSSIEIGGMIFDIVVSGHYAYVAAGEAGLQIVDMSDPLRPKIVSNVEIEDGAFVLAKTENVVAIDRNPPYTDRLYKGPTDFVDVSSVEAPRLMSAKETQSIRDSVTPIDALAVNNVKFFLYDDYARIGVDIDPQSSYDAAHPLSPLPPGVIVNGHRLAAREH